MPTLSNRTASTLTRTRRPKSDKIIVVACEGQVTEEEYFRFIQSILGGIKSKIIIKSINEDILSVDSSRRTFEQKSQLGQNKPWQLVKRLDEFKAEEESAYEFSKHPEDEFWIVADIDENTANWDNNSKLEFALNACDRKNYHYAVSNPFFEAWLLLHHDDFNSDDYKYAVTDKHKYEKTDHFRYRLKSVGAPLINKKHIQPKHYNREKVKRAIKRARLLFERETKHHKNQRLRYPHNLGSTVYKLLEEIIDISDEKIS
ncbi:MAG: RloB family protein [Clostridiales bacterium]|nr:RloB family protein [Clostridiales bacterium]